MKKFFVPFNFLGLEDKYSNFNDAKFVIVPVPYDLTTCFKSGTRQGPLSIINASFNLEYFDEELKCEPCINGIHTFPFLEQVVSSPEDMITVVHEVVSDLIEKDKFPILIGGEHTLSLGSIRALKKKHEQFSVLHLDAHADLKNEYQNSPYSHACVAHRILDLDLPLTQVGIRSFTKEENELIEKTSRDKLTTHYARDIYHSRLWVDEVVAHLTGKVYITIDLDMFDPSIMPAVGTPEPGGLSWYLVLQLLKKVCEHKKVIGFDVMELSPIPGMVAPDALAAKLVYKLIGLVS